MSLNYNTDILRFCQNKAPQFEIEIYQTFSVTLGISIRTQLLHIIVNIYRRSGTNELNLC